jgi:alanine racemase
MARLGFDVSTPESEIQGVLDLPGLRIEGIYTHFTSADGPDPAVTHDQIARFTARVLPLASRIHPRPLIHAANSAATLFFPAAQFDMVRTGIAMYGYPPRLPHDLPAGGSARGFELRQDEAVIQAFRPVMSFKTRLVQVREIEAGSPVSYGGTWIAPRWSRIGTLAVGYADGWSRSLSGRTRVRIGSSLVPQVGRVCMDMCMVDLTDFPAIRAGDEVTLFGPEGPTADDIATLTGSIPYEVLCMVSRRVPRIFAGGGLP